MYCSRTVCFVKYLASNTIQLSSAIKRAMSNVQVCVDRRHSGMRAWIQSVGEHKLHARKEVSSAVLPWAIYLFSRDCDVTVAF